MVKIYGLVCPISSEIRYIGKTERSITSRLYGHIADAKRSSSSHKTRWIRKCLAAGKKPSAFLLHEVAENERWQDVEREWIKRALDMGLPLTNQTAGGEGMEFVDQEAKERYRQSCSLTSRKMIKDNPEKLASLVAGAKRVWREDRERMLQALSEARTDEWRANVAAANAEIATRPEVRKKRSASSRKMWERNRGKFLEAFSKPEVKAKHTARINRCWADPEIRERMMNRWTPEARAKQAAALEARREKMLAAMTPEVRAKQGAKMKEYWARKRAEKA